MKIISFNKKHIAVVAIIFTALTIVVTFRIRQTDLNSYPGLDPNADWSPKIPGHVVTYINDKYKGQEKHKKAMLQVAHALWMTLEPDQDLKITSDSLDRAIDCASYRNISHEEAVKIEKIIFYNNKLTRKYLEWNRQFAGKLFPARELMESACD